MKIITLILLCIIIGFTLYNFKLFFIKNINNSSFYNMIIRYKKNIIIYDVILMLLIILLILFLEKLLIPRIYIASIAVVIWYTMDESIIIKIAYPKHANILEVCILIAIISIEYFCSYIIDGIYIIAFNFFWYKSIKIDFYDKPQTQI